MGLVTKKALVCDRCGASVDVGEDFDMGLRSSMPDGWKSLDRERVLCPECYPGYELLLARHKIELEDYVSNNN